MRKLEFIKKKIKKLWMRNICLLIWEKEVYVPEDLVFFRVGSPLGSLVLEPPMFEPFGIMASKSLMPEIKA